MHDAEADAQARLRTLAELFASGAGPELVSFGGMNPVSVTGSGWFCDIYELIDADAEFDRSDLVAAAAYERDGGSTPYRRPSASPRCSVGRAASGSASD